MKFSVALRSGYFSMTTRRRDRAEDRPSWAAWNLAKASGVSLLGGDLDLADLGPGFGDGREGVLLEVGRALDRFDQVRNEVGPPLVFVFDLGPLGLDFLVEADEPVVNPGDVQGDDEDAQNEDAEAAEGKDLLIGHCGHSPFIRYSIIRREREAGF